MKMLYIMDNYLYISNNPSADKPVVNEINKLNEIKKLKEIKAIDIDITIIDITYLVTQSLSYQPKDKLYLYNNNNNDKNELNLIDISCYISYIMGQDMSLYILNIYNDDNDIYSNYFYDNDYYIIKDKNNIQDLDTYFIDDVNEHKNKKKRII
eukprot:GHVR01002563.1.p1 GENE.GHVR01002563.1~~GHVR01002563.1.p1  ORF type:complete len:153 (+),score=50.43 GHVR01002563.1:313-771(+)